MESIRKSTNDFRTSEIQDFFYTVGVWLSNATASVTVLGLFGVRLALTSEHTIDTLRGIPIAFSTSRRFGWVDVEFLLQRWKDNARIIKLKSPMIMKSVSLVATTVTVCTSVAVSTVGLLVGAAVGCCIAETKLTSKSPKPADSKSMLSRTSGCSKIAIASSAFGSQLSL